MKLIDTLLTIKIIHEPDAVDAPFVAYIPEFDISSCGANQEEAITHVKEALNITLAEAKKDGTINQVMREAGFDAPAQSRNAVPAERPRIVVEPFAL